MAQNQETITPKLGIPTQVDDITINALPLRAYNLIYNTWFRDENLQNSLAVSKTDGPDADSLNTLQKRAKRHLRLRLSSTMFH